MNTNARGAEPRVTAVVTRVTKWLTSTSGSLRIQVFRSGIWLVFGNLVNRVMGTLRVIVLGRLLLPVQFGLFGIALLVLQWLDYFTQSGFSVALIQKSEDPKPYFNTLWTVEALRGLGLCLLVVLGAPFGAQFFNAPAATPMIRTIGLVFLLRGLSAPAMVCCRRALDFRREVLWRLSGTVTGFVTAVALALLYRNAWALVLSMVAAQFVETVYSYRVQPFRPRWELDWVKAREMFRFGRWISWAYFMVFLSRYVDSVAVGRFLGTSALGFYEMASRVSLQPAALMGGYLSGLMLPAFTKLERREDLRRGFLRSLELLATVVLPTGCLVSIFALPLVRIVLGERWLVIVPVVRVLIWAGVFTGISDFILAIPVSLGRPRILTISNAVKAVLIAGLFYPLMQYAGNTGVAVAVLIGSALTFGLQMHVCCRMIELKIGQAVRCCRPGLLASLPVLAAAVFVQPGAPLTAGRIAVWAVPALLSGGIAAYHLRRQFDGTGGAARQA